MITGLFLLSRDKEGRTTRMQPSGIGGQGAEEALLGRLRSIRAVSPWDTGYKTRPKNGRLVSLELVPLFLVAFKGNQEEDGNPFMGSPKNRHAPMAPGSRCSLSAGGAHRESTVAPESVHRRSKVLILFQISALKCK